jgi:trk system potassium uptake protein TrkH
MKDEKLTPRIAETAKQLWLVYLAVNALCCLAFWQGGMGFFDAITHAFATIATGGFSTHDSSLGFFNSAPLEILCGFFSLVGGINFALIYLAWRARNVTLFWQDAEFRFFLLVYFSLVALVSLTLYTHNTFSLWPSLYHGFFQTISIITTNGLTSAGYPNSWPMFAVLLMIFGSFFGGCAGSTAGGIKAIRFLLLHRQSVRELKMAIRPRAEIAIKIGNRVVPSSVVQAVWGFYFLYILCFCLISLTLTGLGHDLVTAFGSTAACLNNMGVGLGTTASNFGGLDVPTQWLLIFAMLLGRLEIFPLILIFLPDFRR